MLSSSLGSRAAAACAGLLPHLSAENPAVASCAELVAYEKTAAKLAPAAYTMGPALPWKKIGRGCLVPD
ncbi:hypothetical protein GUJ93_ZPchr0003g16954 [Zizania palustris]|uniref:Uncharacterized protein n=1 Tax=Zizania palustris TaxID=103762 RepID=A0A8J5S671_ZIZPA|nr:hypothetical protein GUJ93_ZPchr0003g16954 [Zizania palustris]